MSSILDNAIEYLKGVGPQRGDLLKKEKNIFTFGDLLEDYPFRYIDKTEITRVADTRSQEDAVLLQGRLTALRMEGRGRQVRLHGEFSDGSGVLHLVWFQRVRVLADMLIEGGRYLCYGKVTFYKGRRTIRHPELEPIEANADNQLGLAPVYNTTEKLKQRGLHARGIAKLTAEILRQISPVHVPDPVPTYVLERLRLISRYDALRYLHYPRDRTQLEAARRRMIFEEFFLIQLQLWHRYGQRKHIASYKFDQVGDLFNTFYSAHLPFSLTDAQKRVIKEIRRDLGAGHQMNRLLQGDVGSGKTIVALLIMLIAADNGYQSCLMAPTEILAQQHYQGLKELIGDLPIRIALLTGQIKGKQRQAILDALADGELHFLVGTHAVIEDPVVFHQLGLAIIDEQHRFGVAQRSRLYNKAKPRPPHVLVMTATPIPRTLALTTYGDLDFSIIDELPPGRKPVTTRAISYRKRGGMYNFIKKEIAKGRQVYVVYPLINESEKLDLANLQDGYEQWLEAFPRPAYQISIVHGQMKSQDKDQEMERFVEGRTQILVATTVIEVGVNVPNATVMIIENAERFGLAQLHQLRGRVGRGEHQSYCLLMTGLKLSKEGRKRMEILESTNDGFKLAEEDLKLRGPGDVDGLRQSGGLDLKLANPISDQAELLTARKVAKHILDRDPHLQQPEHASLAQHIAKNKKAFGWRQIG